MDVYYLIKTFQKTMVTKIEHRNIKVKLLVGGQISSLIKRNLEFTDVT